MPSYRYRCPECRKEQSITTRMDDFRSPPYCACNNMPMDRLYGDVNFQFRGGRDVFRDGIEGTGETVRETADRWVSDAKAAGLDPEPAGTRWV